MSGRQKIIAGLMTLLALVALCVSGYLTWVAFQSTEVAGCTAGSTLDCGDVLASRWSKWFGLPVSLFGAVSYVGILALCWPAASRPGGLAMLLLLAMSLLAGGAAVWFIGLQVFHLHSFCLYCMTVHACGLLVAILAVVMLGGGEPQADYNQMRSLLGVAPESAEIEVTSRHSRQGSLTGLRLLSALAIAAASLSALMGGQLLSEPEATAMEEIDLSTLATTETTVETTPDPDEIVPEEIATDAAPSEPDALEAEATQQTTDDATVAAQEPGNPDEEESEFGELLDLPGLAANAIGGTIQGPDAESATASLGARSRRLVFTGLPEAIDTHAMPIVGNPRAEHVIVKLMDYTCGHCRQLHPHLLAAADRYGDQLAIIIHHIPLSKKCNPLVKRDYPGKANACDYAKLAIGVWKLEPEKFPEYHDWLMASEKPPSIYEARTRAISLVGDQILLDKKIKAETGKRIAKQSATLEKLNVGLPVLLLTNGALRGVPVEQQQFFDFLENKLGLQPRGNVPENVSE